MELPNEDIEKMNYVIEIFNNVARGVKKGRTENVYQNAIIVDLQERSICYTREETIPIIYKGRSIGQERIDIILNSWFELIIELKATTTDIKSDNIWQLLNYMKYKNYKYGVVVNFNQSPYKDYTYSFVTIQNNIPYTYDIVTNKLIEIKDHDY
jgi:GxxExxY protein